MTVAQIFFGIIGRGFVPALRDVQRNYLFFLINFSPLYAYKIMKTKLPKRVKFRKFVLNFADPSARSTNKRTNNMRRLQSARSSQAGPLSIILVVVLLSVGMSGQGDGDIPRRPAKKRNIEPNTEFLEPTSPPAVFLPHIPAGLAAGVMKSGRGGAGGRKPRKPILTAPARPGYSGGARLVTLAPRSKLVVEEADLELDREQTGFGLADQPATPVTATGYSILRQRLTGKRTPAAATATSSSLLISSLIKQKKETATNEVCDAAGGLGDAGSSGPDCDSALTKVNATAAAADIASSASAAELPGRPGGAAAPDPHSDNMGKLEQAVCESSEDEIIYCGSQAAAAQLGPPLTRHQLAPQHATASQLAYASAPDIFGYHWETGTLPSAAHFATVKAVPHLDTSRYLKWVTDPFYTEVDYRTTKPKIILNDMTCNGVTLITAIPSYSTGLTCIPALQIPKLVCTDYFNIGRLRLSDKSYLSLVFETFIGKWPAVRVILSSAGPGIAVITGQGTELGNFMSHPRSRANAGHTFATPEIGIKLIFQMEPNGRFSTESVVIRRRDGTGHIHETVSKPWDCVVVRGDRLTLEDY